MRIGWVKSDRLLVLHLNDGILVMVADGHGGSDTVDLLAQYVAPIYLEERAVEMRRIKGMEFYGLAPKNERSIIRRTIQRLIDKTASQLDGSTLTLGFIQRGVRNQRRKAVVRVHVGQIGDSLLALSSSPGRVSLTPNHSVSHHEKDVQWIVEEYQRLHGEACKQSQHYLYTRSAAYGLSLTRALGDRGDLLVRKPEVKTFEASINDAILLFATDGLLIAGDPVRPQVNEIFGWLRQGKSVKDLGSMMERKNDNVTMISLRYPFSSIYAK